MRFHLPLLTALAALAFVPAAARTPPTPEQRIDRLEKQVRQVQKQVFPKGQPADTAGFVDDPAATQDSVNSLGARLDSIERQMTDLVRASEENGNRLSTMEAELARLRADQDQRLRALENAVPAGGGNADSAAAQPAADVADDSVAPPPKPKPKVERTRSDPAAATATTFADPAEGAYDEGYQLWNAGKYDAAIASLRKMVAAYPGHRRVSWANNLIGRALLDKGQYRAAAEALLANYRSNKDGERAPDSLYYLGQASMKLGQPAQACKAYAELENVYGATIRPALRQLLTPAKAEAKCK